MSEVGRCNGKGKKKNKYGRRNGSTWVKAVKDVLGRHREGGNRPANI